MRINLWPDRSFGDMGLANEGCPCMETYLLDGDGPHPLVVVYPGGGYVFRAAHEGEPIARWLNGLGVSAVVVHYRVAPYRHPSPLEDAQRAIRLVRHHADEWNVDRDRVGVLGFSAGGHLASTVGTHYDHGDARAEDPVEREGCRPDFMVLCYPVISMDHGVSRPLLGENPEPELISLLSNEKHVTTETPPAFLWHTADDEAVPVNHVYRFALALSEHHVPHDVHVFRSGNHGLGLADVHREVRAWTTLCEAWMKAERIIRAYPAFDAYSTVRALLTHEAATAVLEKYMPGFSTDSERAWMTGLTLKNLASIPEAGISEATVVEIAVELAKIPEN